MRMNDTYLDKAYSPREIDGTRRLYDAWSPTYEAEIIANGYAAPARCAEALADFVEDTATPVLDFGCGTGLSGLALRKAGFQTIDGMDMSPEMLAQAKEKDVYRTLTLIEGDAPVTGSYGAIAAVGVIGTGEAPISIFDRLLQMLDHGGKLTFSLNDHALADPVNTSRINEWLDCGAARLLFMEYGDHLPEIDIRSNVYVIEKA